MKTTADQNSVGGPSSKEIRRARNDFHAVAGMEPPRLNRQTSSQKRKPPPPISLRLTAEEREKLQHLSAGMTLSAYIRQCVFGPQAARRKRRSHVPVADQKELARVLALLGASRIANNLNQLAYQANTGSLLLDDTTLAKIEEAYNHVRSMRNALMRALGLMEETNA